MLVNTSLRPFSPWFRRLKPANYATLLGMTLRPGGRIREQTILRLTSRHLQAGDAVVDEWTRVHEARPVSAANALRQPKSAG